MPMYTDDNEIDRDEVHDENDTTPRLISDDEENQSAAIFTDIRPPNHPTVNDILLGPYEPSPSVPITTAPPPPPPPPQEEGSHFPPIVPPSSTSQPLQQHRRSILRSSSARRLPPHQQRLSFLTRSSSGTSRTNSFRRTVPSRNNSTNNNNTGMDRSDGSIRSSTGSVNSATSNMSTTRMMMINPFKSSRARRPSSMSSSSHSTTTATTGGGAMITTPPPRRYKVGDNVLVIPNLDPNDTNAISIDHSFVSRVNKHGFIIHDPRCQTDEEYHGPYQYIVAQVLQIHYEEIHPYYTVQRYDLKNLITTATPLTSPPPQLRADSYQMEPLLTRRHEMAALQAATNTQTRLQQAIQSGIITPSTTSDGITLLYHPDNQSSPLDAPPDHYQSHFQQHHSHSAHGRPIPMAWYQYIGCAMDPFRVGIEVCHDVWQHRLVPTSRAVVHGVRTQANLMLYGHEPYLCRIRFTMRNVVVLCSTWFMFSDQVRLAYFPPSADNVFARINFGVWVVLVFELISEVFIRPEGYQGLLISEKAFSPTTVRYINTIHLVVELLALCVFIPEFFCLFTHYSCSERLPFSFYNAVLIGVIGPTYRNVFLGHAYIALVRIRIFGMIRHWKNMWVTRTFIQMTWRPNKSTILSNIIPPAVHHRGSRVIMSSKDPRHSVIDTTSIKSTSTEKSHQTDRKLTNASNIGTALMAINSYRSLAIVCVIAGLFPIVFSFISSLINPLSERMTSQLQATNIIAADTSNTTCRFLDASIKSWLVAIDVRGGDYTNFLMTLDIQPRRCNYSDTYFVNVDVCRGLAFTPEPAELICLEWNLYDNLKVTTKEIAQAANVRSGSITELEYTNVRDFTVVQEDGSNIVMANTTFSVTARFDHSTTIEIASGSSVLLQLFLLLAVLGGLSILRRDVEIFVLGPLRRMLKIVDRYARNPLIQTKISRHRSGHRRLQSTGIQSDDDDTVSSSGSENEDDHSTNEELGSFETEQLITAVAKITDLLRKCWGVAGADIISTNLSTQEGTLTEVFNPTVPGKSVYALFGFVTIGGFDNALRNLGGEVMPLINDVAHVVHGEVFRWGFGDSGQCNKNLGSAFLMVFRIGLVKEVIDKLEQATDVVFSTSSGKKSQVSSAIKRRQYQRNSVLHASAVSTLSSPRLSHQQSSVVRSSLTTQRKQAGTSDVMKLSLQSLPGISTFTDRAVIGMLKSYAGIYRDRNVLKWNQRLGASEGAFKIGMIFGMDAGWAVEGAVGSEYKIDATYLSPHVNMASRMMSACKQYDVTIMLSQAVQELMSEVAQTKLRHLDTVTVKGSSVKQKIYTYDARARGVDFFLHSRSDTQADFEAEHYSPSIWNNDPDLIAMRQHVTEDFLKLFKDGHKAFLVGDWPVAIQKLEQANGAMFESAIADGYLEDEVEALNLRPGEELPEKFKQDNGDGPSMYLISIMKSYGGVAPDDWDGWHPLNRK